MKNLNIIRKMQFKAIGSFVVLLCCLFGFMGGAEAQVRKAFTQRPSTHPDNLVNGQPIKKIYNVKGDFTMIGNTNMRRTDESDGDNSSQSMKFVNVDNSRINSSSATLQVPAGLDPACTNIVFAGLYWSGRANTNNMDVESGGRTEYSYVSVPSNQTNRTIYSNTSSIDYTSYNMSIDIDGNDRIFTFSSSVSGQPTVQFKRRTSNGSAITYRMGTSGSWLNPTGNQTGGGNTRTLSSPFVIFDEGVNGVKFTLDRIGYDDGSFVRISVTGQYRVENQVPVLLNKRKVQIKGPGSSTYTELEANANDIRYNNISSEDNNQMYAGYVEITDYVKNHRFGEYTVADLALSEGNGGSTGYYGGWGMVVIYGNPTMKWRDVTVFDGFAYVAGGGSQDFSIALDGFSAVQEGPVNVTMGIMAGEGDRNIGSNAASPNNKSDYFEIATANTYTNQNPMWQRLEHGGNVQGNFFNSSIYTGATPTPRNPELTNNTGVDIAIFDIPNTDKKIIDNKQTGTKFRYGTEQDTYIIYNITFAVDAYIPEVEPENTLVSINGNTVADQHNPVLTLNPNDELTYTLSIKNTGAEAVNNAVVSIPMPYTGIYVSSAGAGSSHFTPASPQPSFNPITGMLTWNLGTLPKVAGDPVLATMTYKIRVTDDCYILTNNECPAYMIVDGSVSGTGANSQASLGDAGNFIFGRNAGGAVCENSVITSPTGIKVNPGSNCSGTEFQNKTILFCESDVVDNKIPVSVIRNQFPAGTRFYSGINPGTFQGTGTEYNNDTPFPGTPGTEITYYGIPPRGEGSTCSFMFKIKVTSIEGVPNVTNPTYCVGEEAPLLSTLATVSVPGYQLFFYESATATTPLDVSNLRPSTATAQDKVYWVAQGTTTCIGERVSFTVSVIDGPAISSQPQNLTLCEGGTGSITGAATGDNLTYAWEYYDGAAWVPLAGLPEVTVDGATVTLTEATMDYDGGQVRVTVSNGNCEVLSEVATVTINALPVVAAITGSDAVCIGSSVTLSSTTAGGVWSSGDVSIATVSPDGVVTGVATGTVTISYTVTNGSGCTTVVTKDVTINALPVVAAITGSDAVCIGSSVTLSSTTAGGVWSSGDVSIATVSPDGVVTGVATGTVTIRYTVTNGSGCTTVVTKDVTINALPVVAAITGSDAVCIGSSVTLSSTTAGGVWSSGDVSIATVSPDGVVTGVATGTVTIRYTVTNDNGCTTVVTKDVTINALPVVAAITGSDAVCIGSSVTLSSTTAGGVWSSGDVSIATVSPDGVVTGVATGTVTIRYTVTNDNGCTTVVTKDVTINALPVVAAITGSDAVCIGSSVTLSSTTAGGVWSSSNPSIATVSTSGVVTGVATGTVTIRYTVTNGSGCTTVVTKDVTINALPVVAAITGSDAVCIGSSVTLSSTTAGGVWSSGDVSIATVSPDGVVTGVATGTVTIRYTVTNGSGCTTVVTKDVTINALPVVAAITGSDAVCIGSSVTLSSTTAGGVWSSGDVSIATVSPDGVVTGVATGTVTIRYTVTNGSGCTTVVTKDVTINALPVVAAITGSDAVCIGSSVTLSSTTAGGVWSSGDVSIATVSPDGVVTGVATGTVTIRYTVTNGSGCTTVVTKDVTINALPVVAAITGSDAVCIGSSVTLSSTTAGGVWSSGDVSIATVSPDGVVTGVATGTVTIRYTVTNGSGCTTVVTKDVTINALPVVAAITGSDAVCIGSSVTLSSTTAGGVWSSGDVSIATVSPDGVVTGVATGTVTIRYTVTNGSGCTTVVTKDVTINALPVVAAITGSDAVCIGSSVTLSSTTAGGVWSSGDVSIATVSPDGVVTGVATGTVTIRYTVTNGSGCTTVVTKDVTINALPVVAAITGSDAVCIGSSVTLSSTTAGGVWSSGDVSIATVSPDGVVTGVATGTVTIRYTVTNGSGCTTVVTKDVTINALPVVAAITGSDAVCIGSSVTLSSTTAGGVWSSGDVSIATVSPDGVVTGVATGTVTIRYTVTNGSGCTTVVTKDVTINALPVVAAITGSDAVCIGSSVTLSSTTAGGVWSSGDVSIATVSPDGVVTGVATGTVTIRYTVTNGSGCTTVVTKDVTINALPVVAAITGSDAVCIGSSVTLSSTTAGGVWSSGDVSIATVSPDGVVTGVATGTVTIRYTVTNGSGCTTVVTKDVTINALPVVAAITGSDAVCIGSSVTLSSTTAGGVWSSGDVSIATVSPDGVVTGVATGTVTIRYTVTNGSGCTTVVTKDVTINPLPAKYEVTGSGAYCADDLGVIIGLSGSEAGISYQLVKGGLNVGSAVVGNGNAIDFGKHAAGTYSVVATNTTTQCAVDMTGTAVIVENMVQGGSIIGAQVVCVGTMPNAFTSSVDATGTGTITYQWESKVAGGTWTMIANATSATYRPSAATVETSYRRVAYSTIDIISSCPAYSNEITITIASDCNFIAVKTVSDNGNDGNTINNKAESNENLTYSITIDNNYDRDIVVNISDAIPANTTFVSVQNGGIHSAGTITWDNVTVLKGGSATVTFVVKATADLTGIANIVNTAVVSSPGLATQNPNVTIPTDSKPSHSSVKTVVDASGDNKAQSGEELTYTITVKNTGDVALTGVAISDAIPANTTYVANSATGGGSLTGSALNWSVNVPFGGEVSVSFKVTVNADLTGVTSIKNIATVGGDTPEVEIPTDSKPSHSSVKTVVDASGDNKAQSGEELTYTITVKNTGDVALTGIAISDAIPANTTYVANSATGNATLTGSTLNWSVNVPFGGEVSVSFKVTVNADLTGVTSIKNIATVGGDTPEVEIPTDSKPSHSSVKTVVDASGDNKAQSGEELTYTITVKNTGDVALTGIAISDAIPANTTYVANSATGGGSLTGSALNWSVNVPFGGEVSVSFKVTVNADLTGVTAIKNIATVGGDTPEVEIPTDSKPSHSSVKTVADENGDNKAQAGELLTYTIKIENDGDVDLKNLLVTDMIPAYTTYEEGTASNGAVFNSGKLTWTVNVPFGQALSLSFKVKVNGDLTEAAEIRNIATVGDKNTPPAIIETDRFARISLDQKHNLGTSNDCFGLKVNDKITYTFTVKNTGNVALNNLDLTSTLSPRLGNITSTAQGALLPGATREFTAEYVINQADINRGFVTGTAKVIANTPVGQITGAVGGKVEVPSNEVSINICQTGKVAIEKTVDKQEVSKVGEELTYTVKVTNTGNTDLEEVTVEDVMLNLKEVINLTVGEVKTYQLKYTVTYNDLLKTSLDNIASATLKTREKVTDEASTKVRFEPEISIVKSADKSVITFLGELVEYTIEVTNTGTVDLVSVVVTDPMFPNFTGTVGNLAKGETRKFDLTYESVLADIIRGEIRNTARVQGKVGGAVTLRSFNPATGVIEKLSNEVLVKVIFNNVLEVTKDADKTEVNKEGEVITYTIKVANKGNYDLTDVVVKDPLTGMMETVGNMAVGAEKTFKTTYKVRRADFDKGSIVNEVLVTAKDLAGGQLDGRAERIVGIAKMPFFIPNVFTPNDDGTNDTFEIEGIEGFDRIEVTILNRWGNEVYRNSNYKNEWTGHGLNEGTYFYIVKTIKGTKEDLYKGHVLIKTR